MPDCAGDWPGKIVGPLFGVSARLGQPVAQGVAAGALLPGDCLRSGAPLRVLPIGFDLSLRCHFATSRREGSLRRLVRSRLDGEKSNNLAAESTGIPSHSERY
jgi:hypothetical protein